MHEVLSQVREEWWAWARTEGTADLAQLHEDVDDAQEVAGGEGGGGVGGGHVVLVQRALALGEAAAHHVLMLARQLLLHLALQPPQQEWPQHAVQPLHQRLFQACTVLLY